VSYYSIDNLSQDGATDTATLIVDDTGPDVMISGDGGSHVMRDGSHYATSSSTFNLEAHDKGPLPVGVGEVEYEIWSPSGWSPPVTFSEPFSLGNPGGKRYIRYQGVDLLGNIGILKNSTVLVDDTPPNSSVEVVSPKYGEYILPDTPLTIVAIDSGPEPVGLDIVEYGLDGDATWLRYLSPIRFAGLQDGHHEVRYRGVDLLGNTEVERIASVILDGSPPVTTMTDIPADMTRETVLTLSATDTGCGLNFTQYKIDDGSWTIYAGGFTLDTGEHDILYRSVDNLGNMEDEKSLRVSVPETESGESNYKPLVAAVFAVILVILGLLVSWKRPWKGERKKIAMLKTFAFFSLPFVLAEAVTGIASHLTGELSIPPIVGLGTIVDVCVLFAGFSSLTYYKRGKESSKSP